MEAPLTAIELTGMIDEERHLLLDDLLPVTGPQRVRVIVLYPASDTFNEAEWLGAAARNPAFADLADAEEDVYSMSDGKPYHDEV